MINRLTRWESKRLFDAFIQIHGNKTHLTKMRHASRNKPALALEAHRYRYYVAFPDWKCLLWNRYWALFGVRIGLFGLAQWLT